MDESAEKNAPVAFSAIEPRRDLWPGISATIQPQPKRVAWRWVGVAASAVLAVSLTLSMPGQQWLQPGRVIPPSAADMQRAAQLMQVQHRAEFGAASSASQGVGMDDAMDGLLAAEREIHLAVDSGMTNPALLDMLAHVHRRQLDLIHQSINVRDYL